MAIQYRIATEYDRWYGGDDLVILKEEERGASAVTVVFEAPFFAVALLLILAAKAAIVTHAVLRKGGSTTYRDTPLWQFFWRTSPWLPVLNWLVIPYAPINRLTKLVCLSLAGACLTTLLLLPPESERWANPVFVVAYAVHVALCLRVLRSRTVHRPVCEG